MNEPELRALIEDVRTGALPRRSFIQQMVGLGLTAPMASMILMHEGIAQTSPSPVYKPTKRGGGGPLKVLWWQGATLLQPHFANGTKDQEGSRIFYEPLAVLGQRRQPGADPRRRDPERAERRRARGRQGGALAPEEGRDLARRQAVHRRRRRLQLGVRARPGVGLRHDRRLQGHHGHQGRRPHRPRLVQEGDAVLGDGLRRRRRDDHPEAPVRPVRRRQVARGAEQPQAGRHRAVHLRRLQAGRHRPRARSTRTTTCRTGPSSTRSR